MLTASRGWVIRCDEREEPIRSHGKVVIVTGSTKGIGRAMAQGVSEAGESVAVTSRKQGFCDPAAS